jgi:hypothetical protein
MRQFVFSQIPEFIHTIPLRIFTGADQTNDFSKSGLVGSLLPRVN